MADPPRPSVPPSPDRRKLLVALGYAAANAVAVSRLGSGSSGGTVSARPSDRDEPVVAPTLPGAPAPRPPNHVYDLVLSGGRVIDPESGFDRRANVAIDGFAIGAISEGPLKAKRTIEANGKVVAPGFIDLLSYEPEDVGARFKIGDGVTTNLGMHGINADATAFFTRFTGNCVVNFGGAFDNPWVRSTHFGLGIDQEASEVQIAQMGDMLRQQLADGWIGIDFEPEYAPGTTVAEMTALARIAKEHEVPCFFHGRQSAVGTNRETLEEIIGVAKETGAAVHVEHIISTGGTFDMANSLAMLEKARAEDYDITACMYPYDFWATYLASPRFNSGWQERFRISYQDLQVAGTTERLNESTFSTAQAENKLAAAFAIPEADVRSCLRSPFVMIGSDAIYTDGNNHPRSTGCFARTLGRYARDEAVLSLPDALAKMTILPAQRLEARVPALRKKGRMQRGADADITVFDPATVIDRSTIENPAQASEGIEYVFILGQMIKSPLGVDDNIRIGQPIMFNR
ncbi:MAG: amidohydrolase family protein [Acidimicrobiales bacterium]